MAGASRSGPSLLPRNRYILLIACGALIVGLLQLSRLIVLPLGSWSSGAVGSVVPASSLLSFMKGAGYPSLYVLMTMESTSLPVPSEVVLPLAGYLVSLGILNYWVVISVSAVACLTGALIDYSLAYWLGRPFVSRMLKLLRVHEGALERAERWFDTSGRWTVFLARFVPVLGPVISLPAGLFRMDLKSFIPMTVAGSLGWSAILVYAGFLAGNAWEQAFSSSLTVVDALSAVVAGAAAVYIAYYSFGWARRATGSLRPPTSGS